jgi:DNA-binding response OmpR family regulator
MPDVTSPRRPSVLVVDDEPVVLDGIRRLLQRAGLHVFAANSGADAKDVLRRAHIDALVLDYLIPDVRGDVLYWLAIGMQGHLERRAVFLTGDITPQVEATIAETGCLQLGKPFDIPLFIEMVRALVRDKDGDASTSSDTTAPDGPPGRRVAG